MAGGGTAGHIEPALAVADALQKKFPDLEIEFIGTESGLERLLVPQRGYVLRTIPKVVLPRKFSLKTLSFPIAIIRSVLAARRLMEGTDFLIGFGGYVSASSYLAAWVSKVPIGIHEANAKPGWANRLGRRLAKVVAVNFEQVGTDWPGSVLTGMPIRTSITELAKLGEAERKQFRELHCRSWGLDPKRALVAIFGGSQGSANINQAIADYLKVSSERIQIIHAVGINNPLPSGITGYLPMPYFHDMAAIYGSADLLITRSGAVTCSELMTSGRYSILVPLAHGNGEQIDNAKALTNAGRAVLVADREFTGDWLAKNLKQIVDRAGQAHLAPSSLHLNAAERIADLVMAELK